MSDTDFSTQQEPLGAAKLVGASVKTLLRNFVPLFLLSAVLMVPFVVASDQFSNTYTTNLVTDPLDVNRVGRALANYFGALGVLLLVGVLISGFVLIAAAQILRDGRINISDAIARLLAGVVPLVLLSLLYFVAVFLGSMFFIVPGIWVAAVWAVFTPAILIERKGFNSIARSTELTKGYRWPIVGAGVLIALLLIAASIPSLILNGAIGATESFVTAPYQVPIWLSIIDGLISSVTAPLIAVFLVLLHTRLLQLKEGGGHDVASVFD